MPKGQRHRLPLPSCIALALSAACFAQKQPSNVVSIDWNKVGPPTRTTITLQVVENPPLRQGSNIHDAAWKNLAALRADMTRLALWYPYPRLAVAELESPAKGHTSWDFTLIDPIVADFMKATDGHSSVFTMSTIPSWMFDNGASAWTPQSPNEEAWNYESGAKLRDGSFREVGDYFARVAGWYTAGGFVDEAGKEHSSSHHYTLPWWEVLNEPEYEHAIDIKTYTRLYDQVVESVHDVSPEMKFVGLSLAEPMKSPEAFAYFLNPANHRPGTPLDAISYHFYADAEPGESDATQSYTFFARADGFLNSVRYIEAIRKRLSPATRTFVNEAGCIAADDLAHGQQQKNLTPTAHYLSLCGAVFAYLYAGLAEQGIDLLGASQLLGFPGQFPSVSLLDWKTGQPNARYRVLQLLHDNLGPGDRLVETKQFSSDVFVQAYVSAGGQRKLLLINKRDQDIPVQLPGAAGKVARCVDLTTSAEAAAMVTVPTGGFVLRPFSVMVVQM